MTRGRIRLAHATAFLVLYLSFSLFPPVQAWAQRPTAEPETGLLNPEGVVNVQDLPRVGPRVPVQCPCALGDTHEHLVPSCRIALP